MRYYVNSQKFIPNPKAQTLKHKAKSLKPKAQSLKPKAQRLQPTAYSLQPTAYSLQPFSNIFIRCYENGEYFCFLVAVRADAVGDGAFVVY